MKISTHLKYLKSIGSIETPHSNRTLNHHLEGTYTILKSWGSPEYVCLAGLYHSVYSTKKFKIALLNHNERINVVKRIGPKAELLVFFFSLISIDDLKKGCVNNTKVTISFDKIEIEITRLQYCQLIEIAMANYIEQIPHLVNGKDFDFESCNENWEWAKGIVRDTIIENFRQIESKLVLQ